MSESYDERLRQAARLIHEVGHDRESYLAAARQYFNDTSRETLNRINEKVVEIYGHDYRQGF